jgi:hypothetical protein
MGEALGLLAHAHATVKYQDRRHCCYSSPLQAARPAAATMAAAAVQLHESAVVIAVAHRQ